MTAAKKLVRKSIRLLKTLRFELLFKPPLPKIPSTDSHRAKWPPLGSRFRIFPPAPERKIGAIRFQSLTSSCCAPSPCSSGIRAHRSTCSRRPSHDVGAGEASHTSAGLGVARTNDIVPRNLEGLSGDSCRKAWILQSIMPGRKDCRSTSEEIAHVIAFVAFSKCVLYDRRFHPSGWRDDRGLILGTGGACAAN